MDINVNVTISAPTLIDLFCKLAKASGVELDSGPKALNPGAQLEPAHTAPQAEPEVNSISEKAAPKTRGRRAAAPDPVANATPTAANPVYTLEEVRARLGQYSEDSRYGMEGVIGRLKEFGVDRITALPKTRYAEFMAVLEKALADSKDVDPLA